MANRGRQDQLPSAWITQLKEIEGLYLIGEPRYRVLVEASPTAAKLAQRLLGEYVPRDESKSSKGNLVCNGGGGDRPRDLVCQSLWH